MITPLDLIQNDDFRNFVVNRIANGSGNAQYNFPPIFPRLYRYRALSSYAVNDITQGEITITRVGEFNDLFDGAIHCYGTVEEQTLAAEEEWRKWKQLFPSDSLNSHDAFIMNQLDYYRRDSQLKFRELDYLGTRVGCFSEQNNSTLMWAHYADSNCGICVEYDFNQLPNNNLLRKMIFPVCYSETPVFLSDLISDEAGTKYEYSVDAAVLCAAINKSRVWSYEHEWRIVLTLLDTNSKETRFSLLAGVKPTSISFGYHFIKPFFWRNFNSTTELTLASNKIAETRKLLDYMHAQNIKASIMIPKIGNYELRPYSIDVSSLQNYITKNFPRNEPRDLRFYYSIHDELVNLVKEGGGNA